MDQTENQQTNFQQTTTYTEPPSPYMNTEPTEPVITVKEWMINILLLAIPIVNIVMLFVWAFGGGARQTLSNYAKAALLWFVIVFAIYIVFGVVIVGALMSNF